MLIRADARSLPLQDACVDCCVSSPPYYGLRSYGVDAQIGLEPTPDAYVAELVAVYREVRRVLKPQGTVWLNLGDSYAGGAGRWGGCDNMPNCKQSTNRGSHDQSSVIPFGMKPKDLMGIPWRVAFALQADGWYLRSDIIWHKPNPMPESVQDRPTKAHEYLFLLSKQERYYYDADAIKEANTWADHNRFGNKNAAARLVTKLTGNMRTDAPEFTDREGRNRRSVWTIPTMPYAGAHFATMPEKLVEPCILAGCPLGGLVLDPFVGSGTVVAVAERLGRRGAGVDLTYQDLSRARTAQRGLRF